MRFKIILVAIVLVFLGLAFALSSSRQTDSKIDDKNKSSILASHDSYDFGTISMKDGEVKHVFRVNNTSEQPITIAQIYTSCMCTKTSISIGDKAEGPFGMLGHGNIVPRIDLTLNAGQEALVEAVFDPAAHGSAGVGAIERSVFIENPPNEKYELKFKAMVTP